VVLRQEGGIFAAARHSSGAPIARKSATARHPIADPCPADQDNDDVVGQGTLSRTRRPAGLSQFHRSKAAGKQSLIEEMTPAAENSRAVDLTLLGRKRAT
jgi:hypothetical protein